MLKTLLNLLDLFLPAHFFEAVEVPLLYRARVIVGTNLACLIVVAGLFVTVIAAQTSLFIYACLIFSFIAVIGNLYFFKNQVRNYERNLLLVAAIQIAIVTGLIYLTAFSEQGMGFFGLIWLIPTFLMIAFYFNTRFSFYFALTNFILFLGISYYKYDLYFEPIKNIPKFSAVFHLFLVMVIVFTYLFAFFFVHLSEELQVEIVKQRDLLVESAKFQSLGQMASNLAHDINNPLFTIQGKLHQMRNLLSRDQLDLDKCDKIIEGVESTLFKLSQIVKGISTFAREGQGDQMVSISVAELIESNLALAIDRIKNSGIILEMQIDPGATIICYPSFISQVLLNLINNAIDALETAKVKKIEVRTINQGDWIHIIVSDTGAGVPKEYEHKIFDPFFTTKKFGKGTGLGLSISKGLVEVHEGELVYERGESLTNFVVKLPSYD